MEKPIILREKVYIPSASEYDAAREKYLAFMGAKLSEKARNDGAWASDDYKAGYFFLRSPLPGYTVKVFYGSRSATRIWRCTYDTNAGLRVAFNLIYNPQCDLVKGCRMETRKALVWNSENGKDETVESTAPIIKFGKYDCIWLNKEECEAAYAKGEKVAMQFWTLDLVAKAEPFAEKGDHNDYAKAKKLRTQCKSLFTEEELAKMVEVEMSSEDDYEKATPILETQDAAVNTEESEIHKLFAQVADGKMDEEDLRKALKRVSSDLRAKPDVTAEQAKALADEIVNETEWLEEALKINSAFNQVDNAIDNINLGGEDEQN